MAEQSPERMVRCSVHKQACVLLPRCTKGALCKNDVAKQRVRLRVVVSEEILDKAVFGELVPFRRPRRTSCAAFKRALYVVVYTRGEDLATEVPNAVGIVN